jgi:hypothetical protein
MVASAGLVVGAAMAGWNLGRAAMEFFGLDQAVEKTWASLLGLGNAAEEAAGAKFDAIQLAFVKTGVHAQNATEALALMTTFLRGPLSEQLAAAEAAVAKLTAEQRKQIDAGLALGTSHALIAVSTHTTVAIVDMYVAATGRATKATKDREQAEKERAAALKVWLDDEMKAQDAAFELEERLRHLGQAHRQAEADDKKKKTAEVNATVLAGPAHNPNPGLYGGPPTTFFHYAEGVRNAPGGWSTVGERGAETMYVPPGADIYPSGSSSGGGIRDVHVHVGGNILGTQYELAQLVKAAIKADDRSRGRVG